MFSITITHVHNSSVGLRQFRCADPCMVKYLENQYPTGFLTCDSFPDGIKWYVLDHILVRTENLCSRIGFYSTIVAISLYLDCRVGVFVNNTQYSGVNITVLLYVHVRFSIHSKIFCKNNPQNKCMYRPLVIDYLQNSPFANVLIILLSNFTCSSSTSPNISCIIL